MKLAHFQIEQIKEYIDSKSIWYDDVKTEILDHVATAVEEKMATDQVKFVDACGDVFLELDVNKFQRHKLKYEHLATYREVGSEMLTFFKGKRLLYLILIITASFLGFSISASTTEWFWTLGIWMPLALMFYFIIIPTYARKYRVFYQSYYMSRINAIHLPVFMSASIVGWTEDWLLSYPIIAITLFSAYHLFVISGLIIMNRTLKQVKVNVALH